MMQLEFRQKQQLLEEGYVVIPGAVSKYLVDRALKAINHSIGNTPPGGSNGANFCKELEQEDVIKDLFDQSPLKPIMDSLIGKEQYYPTWGAQIALRFPAYADSYNPHLGSHLDGMLKLDEGIIQHFTSLVGVLLSDQLEPDMGNFVVYPGSHRLCAEYLREHGPDSIASHEGARRYHEWILGKIPNPVQITGKAGDAVINHFQIYHAGGTNLSPHIRYSCYFRIVHKALTKDWGEPMMNPWMHWPGVRG